MRFWFFDDESKDSILYWLLIISSFSIVGIVLKLTENIKVVFPSALLIGFVGSILARDAIRFVMVDRVVIDRGFYVYQRQIFITLASYSTNLIYEPKIFFAVVKMVNGRRHVAEEANCSLGMLMARSQGNDCSRTLVHIPDKISSALLENPDGTLEVSLTMVHSLTNFKWLKWQEFSRSDFLSAHQFAV